jgi:hypothetical protein
MSEEFKPIPVAAAKSIAEQFDKAMVIINAYDEKHEMNATATYGVTPQQKEIAADAGERTAKALGSAIEAKTTFEDFRHRSAAEAALYLETLKSIHNWCDLSDGTDPIEAVLNIERLVTECFRKTILSVKN